MTVHNTIGVVGKDGTGKAVPITSTTDTRNTLAAFLKRNGSSARARTGKIKGGPAANLDVAGTAGWAYTVAPGAVAIANSDTGGVYVVVSDSQVTVPTDAAPTSGSRYDSVYIMQGDAFDGTNATTGAVIDIVKGVVAATGTPVQPTLPDGAYLIGSNLMTSAATNTQSTGNTIGTSSAYTVAAGGVMYYRTLAQMSADTSRDNGDVAFCLSTAYYYGRAAGTDAPLAWLSDVNAVSTDLQARTANYLAGTGSQSAEASTVSVPKTATFTQICALTVTPTNAGRIQLVFSGQINAPTGNSACTMRMLIDGVQVGGAQKINNGGASPNDITFIKSKYLTAASHAVTVQISVDTASAGAMTTQNCHIEAAYA